MQKVWNIFNMKNVTNYHNLFVHSYTLSLTGTFKNSQDTCLKIYKPDSANFYSTSGLTWIAALKITKSQLELLIDIGILLMVEEGEMNLSFST